MIKKIVLIIQILIILLFFEVNIMYENLKIFFFLHLLLNKK